MFGERFPKYLEADKKYIPYEDALEQVMNDYPGDPSDPKPGFANALHAEVAKELHLQNKAKLKLYSAVYSALDHWHSTDAFFEYEGARLPLDVSKNPAKAGGYKSGVMMIGEEEFDFPARRAEKAKEIADELLERQRNAARELNKRRRDEGGLSEIRRRRQQRRKPK